MLSYGQSGDVYRAAVVFIRFDNSAMPVETAEYLTIPNAAGNEALPEPNMLGPARDRFPGRLNFLVVEQGNAGS